MTSIDNIFPDSLSDHEAAVLTECLSNLALACESHYFSKLVRFHQQQQQEITDPQQPWKRKSPPLNEN